MQVRRGEEALALVQGVHSEPHPDVAQLLYSLAGSHVHRGRPDPAEPLLREALEIQRAVCPGGHPNLATTLQVLAGALFDQDEIAEAEELIEEACALNREFLPANHPTLAASLYTLGALLYTRGDDARAERALREAVEIRRARAGEAPVETFDATYFLALTLARQEEIEQAAELFLEVLPTLDEVLPDTDLRLSDAELARADVRYNAGVSLKRIGRSAEAEPLLIQAHESYARKRGARDQQTLDAVRELVEVFEGLGRADSAAEWRVRRLEPANR